MDIIITFGSTQNSILAEQLFIEENLKVKVMPLPPKIKAGCGICLRVPEQELEKALQILNKNNIDHNGLYVKHGEGKNSYYTKAEE